MEGASGFAPVAAGVVAVDAAVVAVVAIVFALGVVGAAVVVVVAAAADRRGGVVAVGDIGGVAAAAAVEGAHPAPGCSTLAPFARLRPGVCVRRRLAVLRHACGVLPPVAAVARPPVAARIASGPLGLPVGAGVVPLRRPCAVPLPRRLSGAFLLRLLCASPLPPPLSCAFPVPPRPLFGALLRPLAGGVLPRRPMPPRPPGASSILRFAAAAFCILPGELVLRRRMAPALPKAVRSRYHGFVPLGPRPLILFAPFRPC
mmetsp:Transcript_106485/g.217211  ORF Transcript_106485/g.217211 Transcript_106485/m.217211 type:complete len:259 (+) Transcript_106485:3009-3785(+)